MRSWKSGSETLNDASYGRARERQVENVRPQLLVGVEPAVRVGGLYRNVRVLFGKLDPDAVDHVPKPPCDADAHAGPFGGSRLLGGLLKVLRGHLPGPGLVKQLTARLGERDALPVTDEQGKAELILELLDVPAQGGCEM